MSADEDTELRDLVAQTLETNGTLGKLRARKSMDYGRSRWMVCEHGETKLQRQHSRENEAQLRASVFLALEDQEKGQNKAPFLNKELRSFLDTVEGKLIASLVQEFLEYFELEFTLAVFKPETGLHEHAKRANLLTELNILPSDAPSNAPLLACLLNNNKTAANRASSGSGDGIYIAKDLSEKQIADARKKFEFYDTDNSGTIDKDELRNLFLDMFPSFHRNMLDRYVNDEFNAADRNFSSSIDFTEFLGMYKRLFLLCRTVVANDVEEITLLSSRPEIKKMQQEQAKNSVATKFNSNPPKIDSPNNSGAANRSINLIDDDFNSDREDDPFFDDIPAPSANFSTLSSFITERSRSSFLSELEKNKQTHESRLNGGDKKDKVKQPGSSMSSLGDLPALNSGRGLGVSPLAGAPPISQLKPSLNDSRLNESDIDKNLRAIDKRMIDLGLDSQNEEFEYEEDFSQDHSLSQKTSTNSKKHGKVENGSIAEEIDDEEIEDISIEADDLSRSEKSGFEGITTDCSVSQIDGGFDYAEDPIKP